jgi:Type III secretion basal body protein I, YscI, HrpB, PscI
MSVVEAVASKSADMDSSKLKLELDPTQGQTADKGDIVQFRAAMDSHKAQGVGGAGGVNGVAGPASVQSSSKTPSIGDKLMSRAGELSAEIKKDQAHVSRMLEQASRTGDSMALMKGMLALNDYQSRIQMITKTISKATSSVDSLTKLQ